VVECKLEGIVTDGQLEQFRAMARATAGEAMGAVGVAAVTDPISMLEKQNSLYAIMRNLCDSYTRLWRLAT